MGRADDQACIEPRMAEKGHVLKIFGELAILPMHYFKGILMIKASLWTHPSYPTCFVFYPPCVGRENNTKISFIKFIQLMNQDL